MSESNRPSRVGQIVGQRYRLVSELGSGGQGTVFRGIDLRNGDEVAVKIVEPDVHDSEWRERTFREAHALTVLTGTSTVRILHQAWTDDGAFCLIMELLHGTDLGTYLQNKEELGQRQGPDFVLRLALPIVETLEVAHNAGILHRDLKPGNVFLLDNGTLKSLVIR